MPNYEKFGKADLEAAVGGLATIPFFPTGERAEVMLELAKMCPHKEALRFVVDTAKARCKRWPGLSELRGLLCTRFDAADEIDEPNCSIPGFTVEDAEARYLEQHTTPLNRLADDHPLAEQLRQAAARLQIGARRQ